MGDQVRRARDSGYLAAVIIGAAVVFLAWSLPLPIRLLFGIAAGAALVGLVRWEAASVENHGLVLRIVATVRRLYVVLFLLLLVAVVVALITRS